VLHAPYVSWKSVSGYRWQKDGKAFRLVHAGDTAAKNVLIPNDIYEIFRTMLPTADAVLAFANEFGLLTNNAKPETLGLWLAERAAVRAALALFEKTPPPLEWHAVSEGSKLGIWSYELPADGLNRSPEKLQTVIPQEKGSATTAARMMLCVLVSGHLRGGITTYFEHRPNGSGPQFRLVTAPCNLLGKIWLQVIQSIESGADPRICPVCGKSFPIAPGIGRSNKQFCSDGCRFKAWRKRTGYKPNKGKHHGKGKTRTR